MNDNVVDPKVDALTQRAYHDLVKFIHWMGLRYGVKGHWRMNKDDLVAEAFFVLCKVAHTYPDIPYEEFLVVARTSISNMIITLGNSTTQSHRKAELEMYSLDERLGRDGHSSDSVIFVEKYCSGANGDYAFSDDLHSKSLDPAYYVDWAQRFKTFYDGLDELDRQVLDAYLGNNDNLLPHLQLAIDRRKFVYDNAKIKITPLIVARTLCVEVKTVEKSVKRLQKMVKMLV